MSAVKLPGTLQTNRRLDQWLRFNADRTLTLLTGRVEIGQGILTALAQMAAEELDLPLDAIRVQAASTAGSPDEGHTSGSRSIDDGGAAVRHVCAEARAVLLEAAAQALDIPASKLSIERGRISGGDRIREITYWDLPTAELLAREAGGQARAKSASLHSVVGSSARRLDIPDKVAGLPRFVHDMQLPDMLYARVVRPPAHDATLTAFDRDAVAALPGVRAVVRDGSFLGVVAEREHEAAKAAVAAARSAQWQVTTALPAEHELHSHLAAHAAPPVVISEKSEAGSAPLAAGTELTAIYTKPYIAHASMGPSAAVARWSADLTWLEVWTHSQGVYPLRGELARVLDMPAAHIVVHHAEGAGCYGHNGADDAAFDAILLARAVAPQPVRLQWTRADEFGWEPFGPAMRMQAAAKLDAGGHIVDWNYHFWSNAHSARPGHARGGARASALLAASHLAAPFERGELWDPPLAGGGGSDRNAIPLYELPRQRITKHLVTASVLRTSTLRALGAYGNIFAIESFMDELAARAGIDPIAFRLMHMQEPRARAVIELAALKSGWKAGAASDGTRGRGFAFGQYKNGYGYIGLVCEVDVEREPRVTRAVCAVDVGQVINPDGVINQIEGGIIQAISWTLKEAVTFDRQHVTSLDWESYPILGFAETPEIEVHLINRPEEPPLGAGEVATGPTAAAIANAVCHALGARVRDLPLTRNRIIAALA